MDRYRIGAGNWRFRNTVAESQIVEMAQEFAMSWRGEQFLDLHIRKDGDGGHYLGVKFLLDEPTEEAYQKFFFWMRDKLTLKFGRDCKGWSLSNPTIIVKHVTIDPTD